jgi:2-C-methyl-D-erythritol 2,4-cyclodiphosphate synthase
MLADRGFRIVNADVTVIAQRPKLAGFIPAMRERLAEVMGLSTGDVNVKATTEEKLGFTGEGLGIAAHAVALIE